MTSNWPSPASISARCRKSSTPRKACCSDKLIQLGFVESFADYARLLWQSDYVVSTAWQEFFGMSICEAIYCGCLPILPDRLNYPHLLPDDLKPACLYQRDRLTAQLRYHLEAKDSPIPARYERKSPLSIGALWGRATMLNWRPWSIVITQAGIGAIRRGADIFVRAVGLVQEQFDRFKTELLISLAIIRRHIDSPPILDDAGDRLLVTQRDDRIAAGPSASRTWPRRQPSPWLCRCLLVIHQAIRSFQRADSGGSDAFAVHRQPH